MVDRRKERLGTQTGGGARTCHENRRSPPGGRLHAFLPACLPPKAYYGVCRRLGGLLAGSLNLLFLRPDAALIYVRRPRPGQGARGGKRGKKVDDDS